MARLVYAILRSFVALLFVTARADGQQVRMADSAEFLQLADGIAAQLGEPLPISDAARQDFVVIFIPGILGSKLTTTDGRVIWGKNPRPSLKELSLISEDNHVTPSVLDEYPLGVTKQDVYGEFQMELDAAVGGRVPTKEFPYDWRQSITGIADDLDEKIRTEWRSSLSDKQVIIVAHSMGGLVAWTWKNRFYRPARAQYPFSVSRLVLLGTPLNGSCEMLRMLLTGYHPYRGASILEKEVYKFLFSELKAAAYTFPSVFELLPPTKGPLDPRTSCLLVRTGAGETPADHFSIDTWKTFLLPTMNAVTGKSAAWDWLIDFPLLQWFFPRPSVERTIWQQLEVDQEEFYTRLNNLLTGANDFRNNIQLTESPLEGRVTYFYSSEYDTTARVFVYTEEGRLQVDGGNKRQWEKGDGRVLPESAVIQAAGTEISRRAVQSHGALVKDGAFLDFIKNAVSEERTKAVAKWIEKNPTASRKWSELGRVLPMTEVGVEIWKTPEPDEGTLAVLNLNWQTSTQSTHLDSTTYPDEASSRLVYLHARELDDQLEDKKTALPFYEFAFVTGYARDPANFAFALNRYAYSLMESDDPEAALVPLGFAASLVLSQPENYSTTFRANVFNNLGIANERVGNATEAASAYEQALAFGSPKAASNLTRVRGR